MRAHGWKVPGVLLAAALVWGCGGEAESAADSGSERVIPAADAPDGGRAEAAPGGDRTVGGPEAVAREAPRTGQGASGEGTGPVDERPVAVVRSDPEPSRAPAPSVSGEAREARSDAATVSEADEPGDARAEELPAEAPVAEEAVPEPVREPLTAPVGTRVALTVDRELSTRTDRTGDTFDLTVSEDVLGGGGVVLLRRGTRMRGRVLESFESPGSDRPATLALGVEAAEIGGRIVPVGATVIELEHETEARDSDGRSAAKVGAGAVAGALLGKIIGGDGRDALKGAVAGAIAGAAVAHATRDGHAKVPQGARIVLVLDEPLVVEQAGGGPT